MRGRTACMLDRPVPPTFRRPVLTSFVCTATLSDVTSRLTPIRFRIMGELSSWAFAKERTLTTRKQANKNWRQDGGRTLPCMSPGAQILSAWPLLTSPRRVSIATLQAGR